MVWKRNWVVSQYCEAVGGCRGLKPNQHSFLWNDSKNIDFFNIILRKILFVNFSCDTVLRNMCQYIKCNNFLSATQCRAQSGGKLSSNLCNFQFEFKYSNFKIGYVMPITVQTDWFYLFYSFLHLGDMYFF